MITGLSITAITAIILALIIKFSGPLTVAVGIIKDFKLISLIFSLIKIIISAIIGVIKFIFNKIKELTQYVRSKSGKQRTEK